MATKRKRKSTTKRRRGAKKFCKMVIRRGERVRMCWQRMANGCTKIASPGTKRKASKGATKKRRKSSTTRRSRGTWVRVTEAQARIKSGKRMRKDCRRIRKGTKSVYYECRRAPAKRRRKAA